MSELRKDPIRDRWVVLAPDRLKRPNDFHAAKAGIGSVCPFCPGHEGLTPPEIIAVRAEGPPNGPGWSVRVVPNRFPALRVEGTLDRGGDRLHEQMNGIGAHEVIIETPRHEVDLGDLDVKQIESVLWIWSERLRDLSGDIRLQSAVVFRNRGEGAGASLLHPHSQLIAMPLVPPVLAQELEVAGRHRQSTGRCIFCEIINEELGRETRLIAQNEGAIALAPWAPRTSFESWVLPVRHGARFEHESQESMAAVAEILRTTLRRIGLALERPAYNLILHTAPLRSPELDHYHWRIEIAPVLSTPAGFEWGSDCFINPVPPEESAAFLRKTPDK